MRISDWSSDVCSSDLPDFEAIRSVDTDIAAIGYRLATANAPLCDRQEPGLGLLLHTPDQYARDVRGEAIRHFRFAGLVGVEAEIGRASCRERVGQYV